MRHSILSTLRIIQYQPGVHVDQLYYELVLKLQIAPQEGASRWAGVSLEAKLLIKNAAVHSQLEPNFWLRWKTGNCPEELCNVQQQPHLNSAICAELNSPDPGASRGDAMMNTRSVQCGGASCITSMKAPVFCCTSFRFAPPFPIIPPTIL